MVKMEKSVSLSVTETDYETQVKKKKKNNTGFFGFSVWAFLSGLSPI